MLPCDRGGPLSWGPGGAGSWPCPAGSWEHQRGPGSPVSSRWGQGSGRGSLSGPGWGPHRPWSPQTAGRASDRGAAARSALIKAGLRSRSRPRSRLSPAHLRISQSVCPQTGPAPRRWEKHAGSCVARRRSSGRALLLCPPPPQPGSSLGLLPPSQVMLKTKTEKQGWCLGGAGPRPSSCLMALTREATLG